MLALIRIIQRLLPSSFYWLSGAIPCDPMVTAVIIWPFHAMIYDIGFPSYICGWWIFEALHIFCWMCRLYTLSMLVLAYRMILPCCRDSELAYSHTSMPHWLTTHIVLTCWWMHLRRTYIISFVVVILLSPWTMCPVVGGDYIVFSGGNTCSSVRILCLFCSSDWWRPWMILFPPVRQSTAYPSQLANQPLAFVTIWHMINVMLELTLPCCCRFKFMIDDGVDVLCYGTVDKLQFWTLVAVLLSVSCRHVVLVGCLLSCCFCLLWYLASISMHYLVEMLVSPHFGMWSSEFRPRLS